MSRSRRVIITGMCESTKCMELPNRTKLGDNRSYRSQKCKDNECFRVICGTCFNQEMCCYDCAKRKPNVNSIMGTSLANSQILGENVEDHGNVTINENLSPVNEDIAGVESFKQDEMQNSSGIQSVFIKQGTFDDEEENDKKEELDKKDLNDTIEDRSSRLNEVVGEKLSGDQNVGNEQEAVDEDKEKGKIIIKQEKSEPDEINEKENNQMIYCDNIDCGKAFPNTYASGSSETAFLCPDCATKTKDNDDQKNNSGRSVIPAIISDDKSRYDFSNYRQMTIDETEAFKVAYTDNKTVTDKNGIVYAPIVFEGTRSKHSDGYKFFVSNATKEIRFLKHQGFDAILNKCKESILIKANQPYTVETDNGSFEEAIVMSFYRTKCTDPHISYMMYWPLRSNQDRFEWVGYIQNSLHVKFNGVNMLIDKIRGVGNAPYDPVQVRKLYVKHIFEVQKLNSIERKCNRGGPKIYDINISIENFKVPMVTSATGYYRPHDELNKFFYITPAAFIRRWEEGQFLTYEPPIKEGYKTLAGRIINQAISNKPDPTTERLKASKSKSVVVKHENSKKSKANRSAGLKGEASNKSKTIDTADLKDFKKIEPIGNAVRNCEDLKKSKMIGTAGLKTLKKTEPIGNAVLNSEDLNKSKLIRNAGFNSNIETADVNGEEFDTSSPSVGSKPPSLSSHSSSAVEDLLAELKQWKTESQATQKALIEQIVVLKTEVSSLRAVNTAPIIANNSAVVCDDKVMNSVYKVMKKRKLQSLKENSVDSLPFRKSTRNSPILTGSPTGIAVPFRMGTRSSPSHNGGRRTKTDSPTGIAVPIRMGTRSSPSQNALPLAFKVKSAVQRMRPKETFKNRVIYASPEESDRVLSSLRYDSRLKKRCWSIGDSENGIENNLIDRLLQHNDRMAVQNKNLATMSAIQSIHNTSLMQLQLNNCS